MQNSDAPGADIPGCLSEYLEEGVCALGDDLDFRAAASGLLRKPALIEQHDKYAQALMASEGTEQSCELGFGPCPQISGGYVANRYPLVLALVSTACRDLNLKRGGSAPI